MLCDRCKEKTATVRITHVVGGAYSETNLCESCAKADPEIAGYSKLSIDEIMAGLLNMQHAQPLGRAEESRPEANCPQCGMTPEAFRRGGRLGCGRCYDAFRDIVQPILKRVHGSVQHTGRRPDSAHATAAQSAQEKAAPSIDQRICALRDQMNEAIAAEAFERAAVLRDQLRELEQAKEE